MRYLILFTSFLLIQGLVFSQIRKDINFINEGRSREVIISIPSKAAPMEGYPIVFMLHGTSGDASVFYNNKGWKELGQEKNFITVFPSSLKWCFVEGGVVKIQTRFNCGGLLDSICPQEIPKLVDDISFFRKTISLLKDSLKINENKIFISGFSNGSNMIHKVAMDAGDLFKGAAGSSAPLHELDSIEPKNRIPIWYVVGTKDDRYFTPNFPKELPFGGDSILGYHKVALNRALACQGLTDTYKKIESNNNKTYIWSECKPGVTCAPYLFSINKGQSHEYPNGINYPFNAPTLFWDFFNQPPKTSIVTSVESNSKVFEPNIFPNPASDKISVINNFGSGINWTIEIMDMNNKIIQKSDIQEIDFANIDITHLSRGLYFIKIQNTDGKSSIQRFLKI